MGRPRAGKAKKLNGAIGLFAFFYRGALEDQLNGLRRFFGNEKQFQGGVWQCLEKKT